MSARDALASLAPASGTPAPSNGPQRRRRPCQTCSVEVEVEAGVAVDERHRRGRCADVAEAIHQRTAAELAAERDGIPGGRIARMAF